MIYGNRTNVYGQSFAVQLSQQTAQTGGYESVMFEAAKRVPGSKTFDWSQKVVLSPDEPDINLFAAVLIGLSDSHQARSGGGYTGVAWNQDNAAYPLILRAYSKNTEHKVPVSRGLIPRVASIFFSAGAANCQVSIQDYLAILQTTLR